MSNSNLLNSSGHGSVTHMIRQVEAGDSVASNELATRYLDQFVHFAKVIFNPDRDGRIDEPDSLAGCAVSEVLHRVRQGELHLENRMHFWHAVERACTDGVIENIRWESATKRGGEGRKTAAEKMEENRKCHEIGRIPRERYCRLTGEANELALENLQAKSDVQGHLDGIAGAKQDLIEKIKEDGIKGLKLFMIDTKSLNTGTLYDVARSIMDGHPPQSIQKQFGLSVARYKKCLERIRMVLLEE